MSHHQKVEEVAGEQLWVETWSWSDSTSPFAPVVYTSIGGEVILWKERPSERKETPLWLKVLCSIPGINLFCLLGAAIDKANKDKKRWEGTERVEIRIRNVYYDRAGIEVVQKDVICPMKNSCEQKESAVGFFYIAYPKLGASLSLVVTVKTIADITVGHHQFHHETWAGPITPP